MTTPLLIRWSIQEIRRITIRLAQKRIQPAHMATPMPHASGARLIIPAKIIAAGTMATILVFKILTPYTEFAQNWGVQLYKVVLILHST
jgi:hypothetical protein